MIEEKMEKQNISEFGCHGGIVIDEMTIQDDLIITKTGDTLKLVGYVDMDTTNNNISIISDGQKKVQLATHALQFIFHGFTGFRYWYVINLIWNKSWNNSYALKEIINFYHDYLNLKIVVVTLDTTSMIFLK